MLLDMKVNFRDSASVVVLKGSAKLASGETNDCVVRAFSVAFDVAYDTAHKFVEDTYGRKHRKGTFGVTPHLIGVAHRCETILGHTLANVTRLLGRNTYVNKNKWNGQMEPVIRKCTVQSFLDKEVVGTYIVLVSGHAFVIKDGVVIGNRGDITRGRKRITDLYRVLPAN